MKKISSKWRHFRFGDSDAKLPEGRIYLIEGEWRLIMCQ